LSAFSLTWSWLGRLGGLESFGIFGSWILLFMIDLLSLRDYASADEAAMNNALILLAYLAHLPTLASLGELEPLTPS
jgi:hypothetical protein